MRLGAKAHAVTIDLGDEQSIKRALNEAHDHFGRLDILFNNAALTDAETMGADTDVTDIPLDTWNRTLQVNATGLMLCCRYAIPLMKADRKSTRLTSSHKCAARMPSSA